MIPALTLMLAMPCGVAEEKRSSENDLVVTQEGGIQFLSIRDWPVRREQGVVRPATIEEYLSMKFGQMADRFEKMEARLKAAEQRMEQMDAERGALQQRMTVLEQSLQQAQVRSDAAAAAASEDPSLRDRSQGDTSWQPSGTVEEDSLGRDSR